MCVCVCVCVDVGIATPCVTVLPSQTRRRLAEGVELGDKKMILAVSARVLPHSPPPHIAHLVCVCVCACVCLQALAKADTLRKEWGSIDIPESMFVAAHDTLDVIEKEEVVLHDVSTAMSLGKLAGKPGAVDVSKVRSRAGVCVVY